MSRIPELANELLARLIDIGRREAFNEFQQLLVDFPWARSGELMRQGHDVWHEVARRYSFDDVTAIIKSLTVAERDLPNFNCGSVSPVIPLYQHLFNMPGADLADLRDWVVIHTRNGYLPFGSARYHPASWPEYVCQQKEDGDRRLAREQAEAEVLATRRATHQKQREEQQQSRLQLRQSRATLIDSLKCLSPAERLDHIIGDNTHPVTFYPAEWAVLDSGSIQSLSPRVRLAAIQRLADRRTGIWKKLREQLERNCSN